MEYRYVISGLWTIWFVYWFAKRSRNTFICICVKLRIEERLMLRQFPLDYPEYRRHTKALIPRVL